MGILKSAQGEFYKWYYRHWPKINLKNAKIGDRIILERYVAPGNNPDLYVDEVVKIHNNFVILKSGIKFYRSTSREVERKSTGIEMVPAPYDQARYKLYKRRQVLIYNISCIDWHTLTADQVEQFEKAIMYFQKNLTW